MRRQGPDHRHLRWARLGGLRATQHQIGLAGGLTDHLSTHVHLALEYFRAMFKWHTPIPYLAGADGEEQIIDSVNLGITYEF